MTTFKKFLVWFTVAIVLAAGLFIYFRFYFVFGDGVKAGELNLFTYKGYVFKTYEGRLIQAGFKGSVPKTGGTATIQSYIFDFSVNDEEVANELDGKIKVGKVNVDEEMELAMGHKIASIPTLLLFENGEIKKKSLGYLTKDQLLDFINN